MAEIGMAIALSAAASPAHSGSQAVASSVPFELEGGHIFVGAYVNGRGPYRFGFDTGASGIGRADARLTSELSLSPVGSATSSDGVTTATAGLVSVKSLRVGDLEKRGVTLLSRDYNRSRKPGLEPIMGIIARDFFADRLVTIDYPARRITFSKGALDPKAPGVVAYGASFTVPVCFATGCYDAKIDTGSSRSIVIPKELVEKVAATEPAPIGQGFRTNGWSSLYEMQLKEPVKVAGVTAYAQTVLYAEPSEPTINVGSDFLKDYVLTIDQQHRLLRISMPGG